MLRDSAAFSRGDPALLNALGDVRNAQVHLNHIFPMTLAPHVMAEVVRLSDAPAASAAKGVSSGVIRALPSHLLPVRLPRRLPHGDQPSATELGRLAVQQCTLGCRRRRQATRRRRSQRRRLHWQTATPQHWRSTPATPTRW